MLKKEKLALIEKTVKNCKKCSLSENRINSVPGEGFSNANILFIGEAPGKNEDIQGRPFVGRAGKLLDELLDSIQLSRDEVFIANILKCRPPKNRNPLKKEIDICTDYLDEQIQIIKPKIICLLGNFASSYILQKYQKKPKKIGEIHGKTFKIKSPLGELKIIPLYHPAYAIYNAKSKTILQNDFKNLKPMR
jgi:DNA polymerase